MLLMNLSKVMMDIPLLDFKPVQRKLMSGFVFEIEVCFRENSIIWIYWCPSQYVKSIRQQIMDH